MKKITIFSLAAALFFLTSCETTREITLADNGNGEIVTTLDMSQLVGIMKMSGQGNEIGDQKLDSTISLASIADSLTDLTAGDRDLLKTGTMDMVVNMEDEKMLTRVSFPFTSISDVPKIQELSGKMMKEVVKKEMEQKGGAPQGMSADGMPTSFEEYFKMTYSPGLIEMKLDKEKYAGVDQDQGAQGIKQAMDQGLPLMNRYIIHLPKAAKKVDGTYARLSEDKKTVTIENDMSNFFEDASKLEFRIEY